MWAAHERLWQKNKGKYVVVLSVDVLLDPDFLKKAVEVMEKDEKIGGLQAKIYQWNVEAEPVLTKVIDTIGFKIERNRRLTNIGHGIEDRGQYGNIREVFGVEGAVPFFRKSSLEDCRVRGEIMDHDMFWYSEDLDIAWRMRMMGWKEIYAPIVIAYHDRSTTKNIRKDWLDYFRRVKIRRQIPIRKRRLDWRNYRISIMKNDFAINIFKDLPYIVFREIMVLGYALFFEPQIFCEIPKLIGLMPKIFKKRKEIMRKTKVNPAEFHKWFQ
jgi:GT2 family glycosyltransferase